MTSKKNLDASSKRVVSKASIERLSNLLSQAQAIIDVARDVALESPDKNAAQKAVQALGAMTYQLLDITMLVAAPFEVEFQFLDRSLYHRTPDSRGHEGTAKTKLVSPVLIPPDWWDSSDACSNNLSYLEEEPEPDQGHMGPSSTRLIDPDDYDQFNGSDKHVPYMPRNRS